VRSKKALQAMHLTLGGVAGVREGGSLDGPVPADLPGRDFEVMRVDWPTPGGAFSTAYSFSGVACSLTT
jgi:hypothetical protein